MELLDAHRSILVVIDLQGKLVEEASLPVRFVPLVPPPTLKAVPGDNRPDAAGMSPSPSAPKP